MEADASSGRSSALWLCVPEVMALSCASDAETSTADLIVNLDRDKDEDPMNTEKLEIAIDEAFLTESGRELARTVLLARE